MTHVTRGLVEALLDMAAEAEPKSLGVVLAATPAASFEADLGLDAETPILTHFYHPEASGSISAVFGMDLGTPAGSGRARFLTHPDGELGLTERDDLAAAVLVAIPPWTEGSLAAFDRSGRRLPLEIVDAEPPRERLA